MSRCRRDAQIVAVVIVIVDAADVGHQAGPALAAADAFGLHAVADILAGRGRKIGSVAGQVVAVLVIDFITQQSVEVVDVAQGLVVGQLVGPDEFVQFMGLDGHLAVDVVAIGRAGVRPVFTLGVDKVIGDGALELEVRDDLILRPGRVERAGNPVFLVVVGLGKQRVAVAVADEIAVPGTVLVVNNLCFRCAGQVSRLHGHIGHAAHDQLFRVQGCQLQSVPAGFHRPVILAACQLNQFIIKLLRLGGVHQLSACWIQAADPDCGHRTVFKGIGHRRTAGHFPVRYYLTVFHRIDPLSVPQDPAVCKAGLCLPEIENRFLPGADQVRVILGKRGQNIFHPAVHAGTAEHSLLIAVKNQRVDRRIRCHFRAFRIEPGSFIQEEGSILAFGILSGRIIQQLLGKRLRPDTFKQLIQFRRCDHLRVLLRRGRQD